MEYATVDHLLYAWLVQANQSKERFRFPVGLLEESIALMKQLLGDEWLKDTVLSNQSGQPILAPLKNPLRRYLRSGIVDKHVIEIAELAKYFKEFRNDPNFDGKLQRFKGESFWPTFLELAVALRMRVAGFDVWLSPEDDSGLGDFTVEYQHRAYICECARIEWTEAVTAQQGYLDLVYQYIDTKLKRSTSKCCIKIRVKGPLDRENYAVVLRLLRQALEAFDRIRSEVECKREKCSVLVEPLSDQTERIPFRVVNNQIVDETNSEWASAYEISSAPMTERELVEKHARGEHIPRTERVRVFAAFEMTGALVEAETDRIDNKLKKKIHQTAIPAGYVGRIVFIESPTLEPEHVPPLALRIQKRLRHSSRTACVAVLRRDANAYYRHHYSTFLQGNKPEVSSHVQFPMQRFSQLDEYFDLILGEKFPYSKEEAKRIVQVHQREWEERNRERDGC